MGANEIKSKVLQEIMDLMEGNQVDGMKSMSPKFAKPEMEEPMEAMPDVKEEVMGEESETQEDPDMEKLMELYKQLK